MKLIENIKKEIHSIWSVESNKRFIKDTLMFFVATIVFHILYWNTDMNLWIFGPLTNDIFDFFTMIAYKASAPLCSILIDKPFIMQDSSFYFYSTLPDGSVVYDSVMEVIHDCSGIKQLLQWALIMDTMPRKMDEQDSLLSCWLCDYIVSKYYQTCHHYQNICYKS